MSSIPVWHRKNSNTMEMSSHTERRSLAIRRRCPTDWSREEEWMKARMRMLSTEIRTRGIWGREEGDEKLKQYKVARTYQVHTQRVEDLVHLNKFKFNP